MSRVACHRDKQVVDAVLEQLRPGTTVQIRYDPTDPGKSFLNPEDLNFSDFFCFVLAVGLFFFGIKSPKWAATKIAREQVSSP